MITATKTDDAGIFFKGKNIDQGPMEPNVTLWETTGPTALFNAEVLATTSPDAISDFYVRLDEGNIRHNVHLGRKYDLMSTYYVGDNPSSILVKVRMQVPRDPAECLKTYEYVEKLPGGDETIAKHKKDFANKVDRVMLINPVLGSFN